MWNIEEMQTACTYLTFQNLVVNRCRKTGKNLLEMA
jgi:hypothetical protein